MEKQNQIVFTSSIIIIGTALLSGCVERNYAVLASTGTVIGLELSENPATQIPQAKLGYNRAELAFVPTNRSGSNDSACSVGNGAADTGNVVMELRYGDIFDKNSNIYQRLAVGDIAVSQASTAVLFAKNPDGTVSSQTAKALAAINTVPLVDEKVEHLKAVVSKKYNQYKRSNNRDKLSIYDEAAKSVDSNYATFASLATDPNASSDQIKAVCLLLKAKGEDLACE